MQAVWRHVLHAALVLVAGGAWAGENCTSAKPLLQAERVLHAQGTHEHSTTTVALPDKLALALRNETAAISYVIDTQACSHVEAASLWLFRVGAPYTVSHNGTPLTLLSAHQTTRGIGRTPHAYNGRIPALFLLPAGAQSITVSLLTLPYIATGVVQASIGPADQMLPLQAEGFYAAVGYADAASGVLLVLGLITVLLWLKRRNEQSLLWLSIACVLWSVRGLAYFGHSIYCSPVVFELFNPLSVMLTSAAFSLSVMYLLDNLSRSDKLVYLSVAGCSLAAVLLSIMAGRHAALARAFCLLASFGFVFWVFWRIWLARARILSSTALTLVIGLLTLIGCAVHDIMIVLGVIGPQSPSYLFWGFVVLLIGLASMSAQYVAVTLNRAEHSNEELELRVRQAATDLQRTYAQLSNSQQEAARTQERERLLRDMHDGLGAQLMTALRAVERGALAPEQIALSLQDSLDELRLLIDSADMGQHLNQALAGWRNRWDGRLTAAGIGIDWHIDPSLDEVQLPNETVLQSMRILQEAAGNAVKHSQATRLSVRAGVLACADSDRPRYIQIDVTDNGTGLPPATSGNRGTGMKNMAFRATNMGAQLEVTSLPSPAQGCRVLLTLPIPDTDVPGLHQP